MTEIEKYAVGTVAAGALSYAEDDIDEDCEFEDRSDWLAACKLGVAMSVAVKNNPEGFLAWFRSVPK